MINLHDNPPTFFPFSTKQKKWRKSKIYYSGSDGKKNDGVYSAYVTNFPSNGQIKISVSVDSRNGEARIAESAMSRAFDKNIYTSKDKIALVIS